MKLIFFGDPHFDSQTPTSRIDDYGKTSLIKLEEILSIAVKHDVYDVYTTGDFFDKYEVSYAYLNDMVKVLQQFKEKNVNLWSSIGNHDLPYNSMSYFKNTPLNLLFNSGLVKHIKEIQQYTSYDVYGLDFTNADALKSFKPTANKTNILVMHYATNNTVPGDSIDAKELQMFDFVISGHDHAYYKPLKVNDRCHILRPGSLMRRTKEEYNLKRDVLIYMIDTDKRTAEEIKLKNVLPAEKLFKNEAFLEKSFNLYDNDYNDLFNEDFFKSETNDVFEIISSLPALATEQSKNAVVKYLKSYGIIKNQE